MPSNRFYLSSIQEVSLTHRNYPFKFYTNDHEGTASPQQMKVFHISQKQIMSAN